MILFQLMCYILIVDRLIIFFPFHFSNALIYDSLSLIQSSARTSARTERNGRPHVDSRLLVVFSVILIMCPKKAIKTFNEIN